MQAHDNTEPKTTVKEIALSLLGLNSRPKPREEQVRYWHRPTPSYMRGVLRHMNG